jgi:hypothetical protein
VEWCEPDLGYLAVEQLEGTLDQGRQHAITGLFPVHHRFVTGERPAITGITGAARGGGGQGNING